MRSRLWVDLITIEKISPYTYIVKDFIISEKKVSQWCMHAGGLWLQFTYSTNSTGIDGDVVTGKR